MNSEKLFKWMAQNGIKTGQMAPKLGISPRTLSGYKSKGLPIDKIELAQKVIDTWFDNKVVQLGDNIIKIKPGENREAWEDAGLVKDDEFTEFAYDRINKLAESINAIDLLENTIPMPKKKANIMAAAGSGIEAEVIDWEGDNDTINVRVAGLSMLGTFDDDDIVTFRSKRVSRSPYMKKGLIYLVKLDGKMLIKEYNTRKPTADEQGADYIDKGVVKVLKSHNPDKSEFPDIIITQEIEWFAWYDEK